MPKFKTNSQYTAYLRNKYNIKDLTQLSNYLTIDAYEEILNEIKSINGLIIKGAYNLFINYEYERDPITRDIDCSVSNTTVINVSERIVELLKNFKSDIYTIEKIDTKDLSIATGKYPGIRINFRIIVTGTTMKDKGNFDIAVEEIDNKVGIEHRNNMHFYSIERTLADKYVSAIYRGRNNSRTKDFYDLYNLFTRIENIQLFVDVTRILISKKEIGNDLINDWLANYKEWVAVHNINGLEDVLGEINKIIFI